MSRPIRLLAFWPASDFDSFFAPAFLNRPDYEVEIVSGNRTSGKSAYAVNESRLRQLRRRLEAGEFDLVVSGNIWNTPWPGNKGIWTSLAQAARFYTYKRSMLDCWWAPRLTRGLTNRVPFGVIDIRDQHFILPWDVPLLKACTHYFKREMFSWHRRTLLPLRTQLGAKTVDPLESKLLPLSYGVHPDRIPAQARPMAERDVDIFMSGFGNPVRNEIRERCRKLADKYKVVVMDKIASAEDYVEYLQRTKLIVCTESFGCETWRQYEASSAGAVPLINYPFAHPHMPLVPDEHAIYFSLAGNDFEKQIDRALSNPALLDRISRQTRQFSIEHKDRRRIADYIVKTCLEKE